MPSLAPSASGWPTLFGQTPGLSPLRIIGRIRELLKNANKLYNGGLKANVPYVIDFSKKFQ
jgi:hypothetical protein